MEQREKVNRNIYIIVTVSNSAIAPVGKFFHSLDEANGWISQHGGDNDYNIIEVQESGLVMKIQ